MNKRGQIITVIIIAIILVAGIITWQVLKRPSQPDGPSGDDTPPDTTPPDTTPPDTTPDTTPDTNDTNATGNQTDNETILFEPSPNPTGKIRWIAERDDADGGYLCDANRNPEHAIRLYTYKYLNGKENLSEQYLQSDKIKNVCNTYPDVNETEGSARYDLIFRWDSVEGVEGYRVYQYYLYNSTSRYYDYYFDLKPIAIEHYDEGLEYWLFEWKNATDS